MTYMTSYERPLYVQLRIRIFKQDIEYEQFFDTLPEPQGKNKTKQNTC